MELSTSEKIKVLLKRQNMTAGELADKLGQSRQNLSNKMRRDNFSESELREIAAALGCAVDIRFVNTETGESL